LESKLIVKPRSPVLECVWQALAVASHLRFSAESGAGSHTRWRGQGEGLVRVSAQAHCIRFVESGCFLPKNSVDKVPFRASWLWELTDDSLRLSHGRYGADSPTFLCSLVVHDATHLTGEHAHLCGADSYHCSLALTDRGFDVDWSINGPRKDERLIYRYSTGRPV
jgi:hypothetical protein